MTIEPVDEACVLVSEEFSDDVRPEAGGEQERRGGVTEIMEAWLGVGEFRGLPDPHPGFDIPPWEHAGAVLRASRRKSPRRIREMVSGPIGTDRVLRFFVEPTWAAAITAHGDAHRPAGKVQPVRAPRQRPVPLARRIARRARASCWWWRLRRHHEIVTGKQIKDGTVSKADLTPSLRRLINTRPLRGLPGLPGPAGLTGAAGGFDPAKVTYVFGPSTTMNPGDVVLVQALCPVGTKATGGGYLAVAGLVSTWAIPDGSGWQALVGNATGVVTTTNQAFAVCAAR